MVAFFCVNKAVFIFLQAMGKAIASTMRSMVHEEEINQTRENETQAARGTLLELLVFYIKARRRNSFEGLIDFCCQTFFWIDDSYNKTTPTRPKPGMRALWIISKSSSGCLFAILPCGYKYRFARTAGPAFRFQPLCRPSALQFYPHVPPSSCGGR